jgi:hypothetical protein
VPNTNNGRFGGGTSADGNSCGFGGAAAVFLLLLILNFHRRRLGE